MSKKRQPDFDQFLKILKRAGRPSHLPFYEHIADDAFISSYTGVDVSRLAYGSDEYWTTYVRFWIDMGFDCVPLEIPLNQPMGPEGWQEQAESHGSEACVLIRSRSDFESYPWASESSPLDFSHFERAGRFLPDGAKIVGGVCCGPYEWASRLLGTVGMSYLIADDPELVGEVFRRLGALHVSAVRQLAEMDCIGALRQGDDLGFKTSTFLSPALLREWVFPVYRAMSDQAHARGKPFILHSCGQLAEVYNDLIDYCRIDAKHSFEDGIMPVSEFKKIYGKRVTALGGLDVDVICRSSEEEVRRYARRQIELCFDDGYWALGTGNSLTSYLPVKNYLAVLDEGLQVR